MSIRSIHKVIAIFVATFFFALHLGITAYSNSSYISSFGLNETAVSLVYMAGSLLTILALISLPRLIERIGNIRSIHYIILALLLLLALIPTTQQVLILIPTFIIYLALLSLVYFELDIFLEHFSDDTNTGRLRGFFLTTISVAWGLSPFFAGYSIEHFGLQSVYSIAFVAVLIMYVIVHTHFKGLHFKKAERQRLSVMVQKLRRNADLSSIFMMSSLQNFFYAIMVIYSPLHLNLHLGFSWGEIGIIFAVMHIPFILLEYPIGRLADTRLGEKEMMILGLIIAGSSSLAFLLFTEKELLTWIIILVSSRIGMSLVETTNESYFFKKIDAQDLSAISAQRLASPLAYIIAPLCGIILGAFFPEHPEYIFLVLGIAMISGTTIAVRLHDTK